MKSKNKAKFGDFQTPHDLARQVVQLVKVSGTPVTSVVEPTCGHGSFLITSVETFGSHIPYYGFDINADYVKQAQQALGCMDRVRYQIEHQNFYDKDWTAFFRSLPEGILVIGNPPWITNAALGCMGSSNLPQKSNFQRHTGFAAKTGKANFDISEWMLIKLLEALNGRQATLAMLCKTATARKVLRHAWRNNFAVNNSSTHLIDAGNHFGTSVDACLLIMHTGKQTRTQTAGIYGDISFGRLVRKFGVCNGDLVSDVNEYKVLRDIDGIEYRKWRSGVKHDAAKVMELKREGSMLVNGFGERCDIESTHLFPLLKSSDLANDRCRPNRFVLLTQRKITDDTLAIESTAPKTWRYLLKHSEYLDRRRSIIYAKRPRFAVFGVGRYTFAPWKVAISGLYKNLEFRVVGNLDGKPIVVDDTCYFIPCESKVEANLFCSVLNSDIAKRFIRSLVFLDAKRPITVDILKRIDRKRLAEKLRRVDEVCAYLRMNSFEEGRQQFLLFEEGGEYSTNCLPDR